MKAKGLVQKLDELDFKMLACIAADARKTNRALADAVRLSESACASRLRRLETAGVIAGYVTKIRYDRLGAFEAWASITLADETPSTVAALEAFIAASPEILHAYFVSGPAQLRLHVVTANFEAWRLFCARLVGVGSKASTVTGVAIYKTYNHNAEAVQRSFDALLASWRSADRSA